MFDWRIFERELPRLLPAAAVSLELAVISIILGTIIAMLLALGSRSRRPSLYLPTTTWVELARNTPCLFQVYAAYFGLGAIHIQVSPFVAVLGAITFNNAGYLAETFRGGFNAVQPTQMIAARSLGMRLSQAYVHVVVPQVFRAVFHPWTNQLTWALLNTSLGMFIGLDELSGEAAAQSSITFQTLEFFAAAALIYYVMAKAILALSQVVARRLLRL